MKKIIILLFWLLCMLPAAAQSVSFDWVKTCGGPYNDDGTKIVLDQEGNIYTIGSFNDTVDFDPGPGVHQLSAKGLEDIFISKSDSAGKLIWARSIGGAGVDRGNSIALDPSGNLYVTGYFWDTVDFDPGPGSKQLVSKGAYDVFVARFDTAGSLSWVSQIGGPRVDMAYSVKVDQGYSVYIIGVFNGTADFDPGSGVSPLTSFDPDYDGFLLRLDSSGRYSWVKQLAAAGNNQFMELATDYSGHIYVTGQFRDSITLDTGIKPFRTKSIHYNFFLAKMDTAGHYLWSRHLLEDTGYGVCSDIVIGEHGNVYFTGTFRADSIDFDLDPVSTYFMDAKKGVVFVAAMDSAGTFTWARQLGGAASFSGRLALDPSGNVYLSGLFYFGTADFNPGPGSAVFTSTAPDAFIVKLDRSGEFRWVELMGASTLAPGSPYTDIRINSMAVDLSGNIFTTGYFQGSVDFDPGPSVYKRTTVSNYYDLFLHKIKNCSVDTAISITACKEYRSPGGKYTWTRTGVYTDVINAVSVCDSIITVHLTIIDTSATDISDTACSSYTYNGITYTRSGHYTQLFTNAAGCDSAVNLYLHLPQTSSDTFRQVSCGPYRFNDSLYTASGIYTQHLLSHYGCDSLVSLSLNILTPDARVQQKGDTLSAIAPAASYQWMDCYTGSLIPGETGAVFIPGISGRYALICYEGPCSDTSACFDVLPSGMQTKHTVPQVYLYPNPTSGKVYLEARVPVQLSVTDISGHLLDIPAQDADLSRYPDGLYLFCIRDAATQQILSVQKIRKLSAEK